ncbi:LysR family transcriptional regulator [Noviherbaspirillum sp.]|uniref:LysR family transcriptional regulator n=1 Tax=Noviherbaspirillum sp. TaxID=1926288 RepID=UPI002D703A5B|nr:LysR family transcriptional regulator [Noviherbaspirillum sp.]HZW20771.1 LysR family transcriptional regulator [Noviherbaspirillum sp.]
MKKVSLTDLEIFLMIARHLNLSRASVELGITPSALSHALRGIETRLGLRLFNRTTRSVALTEAGRRLLSRIEPAFQEIDDAMEDLNHLRARPTGNLRISCGRASTRMVLLPIIARYLELYPEVSVEVVDNDALIDVVSGGFDAGVRLGERVEVDMVAIPIGPPMRSVVVGTPSFFEKYSIPRHPRDLLGLPCIRHRFPSGVVYRWEFNKDGEKLDTQVNGPLMLGDVGLMIEAALHHAGLAYVFEHMVSEHLAAGRLIQVLGDWCPAYPGFYLYYPSRRQLPAALRAFVELVQISGK